jgi:dTMP kinase
MPERRGGKFITFEGGDGSGKTTQMHLLAASLRAKGLDVVETAEPGGTSIGTQVRRILLDPASHNLSPTAEMLLYFAARAQNVDECILPALNRGAVVLCDRFTDSTLAYQGAGRNLGEDEVLTIDRIACRGLTPDTTILLEIGLETALERARTRNRASTGSESRLDDEAAEFHRRVQESYLRLAARHSERFVVVDARGPIPEVAKAVETAMGRRL